MNLEDEFHVNKKNSWLTCHLTGVTRETILESQRIADAVYNLGYGPVSRVRDGTHEALTLTSNVLLIDHSKVGGGNFLRLVEALTDSRTHSLPTLSN